MMERAHVRIECTLILNKHLSRTFMKVFEDSSLGTSNVIAQQSHSVWQGAGKLENAGAWREHRGKILPSCSLTWVFLSFYLDNEKADKLTKMDHRAKNLGIELWSSLGDSEKDWGVYIPMDYFTQSFTELQYWFNFTLIYVTAMQPRPSIVPSISV